MIIQSLLFGAVLGQLFVWTFSASKAYKKLNSSFEPAKKIRLALLNKVASILLSLIALITFTILVGASHNHPLINLMIFSASCVFFGFVSWRLAYRNMGK